MEKNEIKKIVLNQNNFDIKKYVKRDIYSKLEKKSKSKFITIISGIRRCGKSTLLNYFKHNQKEKDFYLNFEDERLYNFKIEDFEKLYEVFIELYGQQNTFYFDEIQNIKGWEKFIRKLHDDNKKIYITGSNASMLSYDLGTHLTGRFVTLELFPFSFKEFLRFKKIEYNEKDFYIREKKVQLEKTFKKYIKVGGFPEFLETYDNDFLKNLFESILYRDIMVRNNLTSEIHVKEILHYLMSNVSREFSYNSLTKFSLVKNSTTIKDYLSYFEKPYLLFILNRFDKSFQKQLKSPKKIYSIDTGLANSVSFKFAEEPTTQLENVVFLELKRRNLEVYYHKKDKECDFIIRDRGKVIKAIQVCMIMENESTRQRGIEGLIEAMNEFKLKEGLILTEDVENEFKINNKKIIIKPIWKWLLK
jgi:uncharacterized protein